MGSLCDDAGAASGATDGGLHDLKSSGRDCGKSGGSCQSDTG